MRRDIFQAIADPIRREIIEILSEEALTINEVANHFDISRPAISKHVKILNECGLLEIKSEGRERYCQIKPSELIPAFVWINQYRKLWEDRIDSFEEYLIELKAKRDKNGHK